MARRHALGERPGQSVGSRLLPVAVLAGAALCIGGGVDQLLHHFQSDDPRPHRAAAGAALVFCGAVQATAVRRMRRDRSAAAAVDWLVGRAGAKLLLVGVALSFATALCLGPDASARYVFRAALAAWVTWPLLAAWDPSPLTRGVGWAARTVRGPTGTAVVALAAAALVSEAALWSAQRSDAAGSLRKLPPGASIGGRPVNAQGYWDDEFRAVRSAGRLRVAVLGGPVTLCGTPETNCFDRIERRAGGLEVCNFGLPRCGAGQYAGQVAGDVAPSRPDLVLAIVSVAGDVITRTEAGHTFDWRAWRVTHGAATAIGLAPCNEAEPEPLWCNSEQNAAAYLTEGCRRMAACRQPIAPPIEACWQATFASLDELLDACRERELPLALVLAPEDYQVDATLCDTLRRRCGLRREQLDLELPQRRLKRYAAERSLPVVDLLPHFRAASEASFARNAAVWNDAGNAVVEEALSGWLQARFSDTALARASPGR